MNKVEKLKRLGNIEVKQLNLDLLVFFDKICKENNINYSLTGGTLLGAVRHKGFIPWDDDIDVFLTRPEFEKLNQVFSKKIFNNRYRWFSRELYPQYEYVFGRLIDTNTIVLNKGGLLGEGQGLFIDVCVVDGLPANMLKRNIHILIMGMLYRGRRCVHYENAQVKDYEKNALDRVIKRCIARTTDLEFWQRRIYKRMKKYRFDASDYVGNFTSQYGKRELMHRVSWEEYVELDFEGHKFMACKGWEEYLSNIYGDYMVLPPVEKRKGHHGGDVYLVQN